MKHFHVRDEHFNDWNIFNTDDEDEILEQNYRLDEVSRHIEEIIYDVPIPKWQRDRLSKLAKQEVIRGEEAIEALESALLDLDLKFKWIEIERYPFEICNVLGRF